jgi:hypothetical protein
MMNLKLHIAGLNFFNCDSCNQQFKYTTDAMSELICPNCNQKVPQENALSHRTLQVNPTDTIAEIKEQIHQLYDVDTKSQNLLLLNSSFEDFKDIDDYSDKSDDTDSSDDEAAPTPVELENDQKTLLDYGVKDGAQIVDIIERKNSKNFEGLY